MTTIFVCCHVPSGLCSTQLKECSLITNLEEVVNTSTGDDLSQLEDTSSPSVLHHLRHRLMNSNKTYTQVGPRLLLSLNPNKPMPDMSSPEVYSGAEEGLSSLATTSTALSPLEPHVFGMAHQAYVAASDTNTSQAIIILGVRYAAFTSLHFTSLFSCGLIGYYW